MIYDINGNVLTENVGGKQVSEIMLQTNLISHRGLSSAPENTIPAIEEAVSAGYKHIEVDLGWTSDGVCVLLHDTTVDRTSDGTGNIGSMTLEEVSQYDFGSWKSADYADTKIPTLKEALLFAKYKNVTLELDIESTSKKPTDANFQSMIDDIISCGMIGSVNVCCYPDRAKKIIALCPDICMTIGLGSYTIENAVNLVEGGNVICLSQQNAKYTESLAEEAHKRGWKMQVWTINNADTARAKFLAGADWIITDSLLPNALT
jgi:glycerophosphoryl diester phosphodiesterase